MDQTHQRLNCSLSNQDEITNPPLQLDKEQTLNYIHNNSETLKKYFAETIETHHGFIELENDGLKEPLSLIKFDKAMMEIIDELHELRKERSELKFQLSTAQEAKVMLELELQQKEEVLNEDSVKSLEDNLKEYKEREEKILAELNRLTRDNLSFE